MQVYNQLDTGESVDTGTTSLTNILGTNAITGEGVPTITTLADKEIFTLTIANDNTGDVTLKADNTPVKQCRINFDQQIRPRQLRQGMIAKFTYNLTADYYEWTNQNLTTVHMTKGADVASAATITIPADGNYHDVTGTTTITGINSVAVGTVQKLHFDGILTLTHDATNLILPGGKNITTFAGLEIELVEYAVGDFRYLSRNFGEADKAAQEAATDRNLVVTPENQHHHITAAKCLVNFVGSSASINNSYNIAGVVRDGPGLWTISWDTDFANANYFVTALALTGVGTTGFGLRNMAVGSCQVQIFDGNNTAFDPVSVMVMAFGSQ